MHTLVAFLISVSVVVIGNPCSAEAPLSEKQRELVELSEDAKGKALPNISLTDVDGNTILLSSYKGRPLLVTLVYTGCIDVCPTLIENLHPAVEAASAALGEDSFSVITVGFDIRQDTPKKLKAFAQARGVSMPNWKFLSADSDSLDALARAVGFGFYSRPGGFDHFSQVSLVNSNGRLHGQVYGAVFSPPVIVEPLKKLVFGVDAPLKSFDDIINRFKFFCTVYDPRAERYYFNYSLFVGLGIGFACLCLIAFAIVREWRRASESEAGHP